MTVDEAAKIVAAKYGLRLEIVKLIYAREKMDQAYKEAFGEYPRDRSEAAGKTG